MLKTTVGLVGCLAAVAAANGLTPDPDIAKSLGLVLGPLATGGPALVGGIATSFGYDLCKRFPERAAAFAEKIRGIDQNDQIGQGVRRAQIAATRDLLHLWRQELPVRDAPGEGVFATLLADWCNNPDAPSLRVPQQDSKNLRQAFETAFGTDSHGPAEIIERARQARRLALDQAFDEAVAGALAPTRPDWAALVRASADVASFKERFFRDTAEGGGWFDLFLIAIGKEFKADTAFKRQWESAQLAGISTMLLNDIQLSADRNAELKRLIESWGDQLAILPQMAQNITAVLAGNERIELALAKLGATEAERAALTAEVAKLRAVGEFRDGAIAAFITSVGEAPGTPDQYPVQLGIIAGRYRDLLAAAERPRNLPPEIESERQAVTELIRDGRLDEADERLAALGVRLAAWRRVREEELDQEKRDEAGILAERASLARARFRYLDAAAFFAEAASLVRIVDKELHRNYYRRAADCFYDQGSEFGDNGALGQAIDSFQILLDLTSRVQEPLHWAMTQNNLGNALCALGERERGTERLEQALNAYRAALEEYTWERVPLQWAMTQNNLGNALRALGERESGTERLEQAVNAYRTALEEYTQGRVPLHWASTQNNLGAALWALGARESGTERLVQAVNAYRAALEERTQERVPLDWALTQNNLGSALCALGERESGTERLVQAVNAFRAALEEYTQERVPLDWAWTQNNLGSALCALGERESGTERLEQAVNAYRAALEERTQERVPLDWAMTQNNLGNALCALGQRESGTEWLEQAVNACRVALEEYTQKRVPLQWAMTQNNLGNALCALGQRESGTERLEQAVNAYRAALEGYTQKRVPLQWAMTQNNLGNALWALGERESGTARLEEAVAAYRAALEERTQERVPLHWARTQRNLQAVLALIAKRRE